MPEIGLGARAAGELNRQAEAMQQMAASGAVTVSTVRKQPEKTGVHYECEGDEMMRPGRIVEHPTFGRGKIVRVEGCGDSLRLEIMFAGLGAKKIMAKYARLRVVG